MKRPTVVVVTQIPSPYQVELFNAVTESQCLRLKVIYLLLRDPNRAWAAVEPAHEYVVCEDGVEAFTTAKAWVAEADLAVFAWYTDSAARMLIRQRAKSARPWCLWGERPGSRWGMLGRLRRRILLGTAIQSLAPIWGIGRWAAESWRREFGSNRVYENVPYFSDLNRFTPALRPGSPERRVLFSGSLIHRKGVDLLAEAYAQVAHEYPTLSLDFLGTGALEQALRKRLQPFGDRVRFLGFQQWTELPLFYRAADVLCAPSRYDGWGLIVPEGLAAGLPVIATDRMGAAIDLIRPGVNGWRIRAGSLPELVQAMREAASLTECDFAEMSQQAVASAADHSLSAGVQRFCSAVERTINCSAITV
jgi:glycosyltransferase involved in cell wall biosynthesis